MNVIVDTSVWSIALRRSSRVETFEVGKLSELLKEGRQVFLIGTILQELLQGVRSSSEFARLKDYLEAIPMLQLDRDDYLAAAELMNTCRSNGVQASTIDFQIAAACTRHDCALLTSDHDFEHIARFCPLKLL